MFDLRARRWTEPGSREAWVFGDHNNPTGRSSLEAHRVSQLNPSFGGKNSLSNQECLLGVHMPEVDRSGLQTHLQQKSPTARPPSDSQHREGPFCSGAEGLEPREPMVHSLVRF